MPRESPPADDVPPWPDEAGGGGFAEAAVRDFALPDRDWTVLPEGVRRASFAAPSGSLALIEAGTAGSSRVVLVPGVTGSKEDFSLMMPLLAGAGFHVQSYDLAGQYESADAGPESLDPPRRHYDHDLFVADLLALLESGPAPVHVLGYSFAGTIAQLALARRPELFASLALLSTPPRPGQGFRPMKRLGPLSTVTTARMGAALMIWGVRRNVLHALPGRVEFVRYRFGWTRRESVDDIIGLMKRAPDVGPEIAASPVPKLVAVGEHDLWPLGLHREFAGRIGAAIAVYPAGHNPCETSPHQLVGDLLRLYQAAPRRA